MGDNNTPGEHHSPQPARKLAVVVVPLLGLVAAIVGLIVAWNGTNEPIGWFAYAPLSDNVFQPSGGSFVSRGSQLGLAVTGVGLLVLAFCAGLAIGRRQVRR
ncbi:hypothetical protein NtRootA4_31110 [Arthrobacter sp. NtRootA4]|jgi:heme/copper-type cytochrome/quinol oxidase subunit 1|uniref:hypothetical protein n=1 Tax=Paenarthrobacter nicotinovorans TaxID=29320 RepID=UPI0016665AEF|nr:hypothetical protein [Paenarthrobacter nicotinovorans]BCW12048.1 hypothetical protein NtRootA2_33300 [Arthrobacter sp. NtRootA2]BCW16132.1 hypothetical protein NtRootA4_31110 [Arthrobacter sp. NtRootA4]BCW24464.1 hypothetical protein NtRootC7_33310 [Arthrobacter sp. NtRootC7]BCW28733.1 hypothetical protein NtRootC45_33330 [Arthrobacter sp. NtRootC45]BCW33004.1 hypothetical protein NtRootD5_33350 [Arthrobacter sp. NtRootD5]